MTETARSETCLLEDELLALASGARALANSPAEAHVATCATCSALLAGAIRATAPARAWDALAGSTLGPYRIDAQIGAGAMGAVYRAWDPRLGRAIAIKVLHAEDEARAERLAVEARAAAGVAHRAVVNIHDVGIADGVHYVAMELVEGESLRSLLEREPPGGDRARELVMELADGLAAAHARGVIHRDLKPENLIVSPDGLKILDFGLAKLVDASTLDATEPGTVQGTAGYMAPEQARGEPADARADIFAVGAIAYELATGRRAFPGATHADRLSATLRDQPAVDGLGALGAIIGRCLAKEPRDRFQSAADLSWALRSLSPATIVKPATPSRRALLAGIAAGIGGVAGGFLLGRGRRGRHAILPEPRMLTHRTGRVFTARFSHDGTRAVYGAAWDLEPIAIHVIDFATGETVVLDLPSADLMAVSRGGQLAVNLGVRFIDHQSARGQLATVPLAGGVARPLVQGVQDADFFPEDPTIPRFDKVPADALVITRPSPRGFRIEAPVDSTIVDEPGWITHVRVSPDGASIAYLQHPQVNDDGGALVVVDIASRTKRVIADDWTSIAGLAWDPDGGSLWFTAARNGLHSTMHRATLDGEIADVQGPTANRLRIHDIAVDPAGDPGDRRVLGTLDAWRLRAMAGDRDRSLSEISYVSDLSRDGEQVLIGELGRPGASIGAYLASYSTGRRIRIGPGFPVALSPSGERIAANVREATRLVVYSTTSNQAPSIAAPGFVTFARWIDERSLIALFEGRLWKLALDAEPVALTDNGGEFALDPGGRRCAYIGKGPRRSLRVLDLATREVRTLIDDIGTAEVCGWLASPDAIAIRSSTTPLAIERVDPTTAARTLHATIQPPLNGLKAVDMFVLHADGVRYAYSYGQELSQLFSMTVRG